MVSVRSAGPIHCSRGLPTTAVRRRRRRWVRAVPRSAPATTRSVQRKISATSLARADDATSAPIRRTPCLAGGSAGSAGSGSGTPTTSGGAAHGLVGVSGLARCGDQRRSRITFSVRAQLGRARASFAYVDRARDVTLKTLTLRSMTIDGARGVATLRANGMELPSRRHVNVTVVLLSHGRHRSMRIRLSSGYADSGALLSGSISFTRSSGH